jgi:2,4-didehydro-3-deoxy-L-rhamnonate hydrolase
LGNQNPFFLAMVTISGSPAFPAVMLDEDSLISVDALAPLAARCGRALTGTDSLFGLLQNWGHNFAGLCAAVTALADPSTGRHFRGRVTSAGFFEGMAPITWPRQVFCALSQGDDPGVERFSTKLPSAIVGPRAKICVPFGADRIFAAARLGIVIASPSHHASADEAAEAIAGYVTVTDITCPGCLSGKGGAGRLASTSAPTFLPIGPWFVPAAFAGDPAAFNACVSYDGLEASAWNGASLTAPSALVAALSEHLQLMPGDLVCSGVAPGADRADRPGIAKGDIVETAISGLGRQTLNCVKEMPHARRGN